MTDSDRRPGIGSLTYTCSNCGRTRLNASDVAERYCGYCHVFEGEDTSVEDEIVTRFRCTDCGNDVTALGLTVCALPPRCATCAWLQEFVPDPVERDDIRSHFA